MPDKPLSEMTMDELVNARKGWGEKVRTASGWGAAVNAALQFGAECDREIERREHAEREAAKAACADAEAQDAARYRFLRAQHWHTADLVVIRGGRDAIKLGTDCPTGERLDAMIDGALNHGEHADASE